MVGEGGDGVVSGWMSVEGEEGGAEGREMAGRKGGDTDGNSEATKSD